MAKIKKTAYISKQCVACGCCLKVCPVGAITIHNGVYAAADESKCIGCGKCSKECPAGVIEIKEKQEVAV